MTLHLVKLCVGVSEVSELKAHVKEAAAKPEALCHVTRHFPRREAEIIPHGSLYWVIRGFMLCRQPIANFESLHGADGIMRCRINFKPRIIAVMPTPRRAFQGWRYLEAGDAPDDLSTARTNMTEKMQRELAELGLL